MSKCLAPPPAILEQGRHVRVRGRVQGVGFRPFVWRLASDCGLRGRVWNDGQGVVVEVWGEAGVLADFLRRLREEAPPLAHIEALYHRPLPPGAGPPDFTIRASRPGFADTVGPERDRLEKDPGDELSGCKDALQAAAQVVPDAATCDTCVTEIHDPTDRRHRYPFTNCTNCGPRFSIQRAVPYDRVRTSMAVFALCEACAAEYNDPANRRFHAQPNACPDCGPRLWLESADGEGGTVRGIESLAHAHRLLRKGRILAIKGIGGFHLACDASHPEAVARLRRRKQRPHKPFALMARDLTVIERYALLDESARAALQSPAAPVVLLTARAGHKLAPEVAMGLDMLGFMLPYSPLHHLLMTDLAVPIVLTSGNRSGAPQCITNEAAREDLAGIADAWLMHDRGIVTRLDDSIVRVMAGCPRLLRRARGFVPEALLLPDGFADAPPVLAMGGDLKHTFCLLQGGQAVVSQYLGDLEEIPVQTAHLETLTHYRSLFRHEPRVVVVDRHPRYFSARLGMSLAAEHGARLMQVQHHHAHIAAVMAEYGLPEKARVLGVALDGLGYGDDDTLWGGEFLAAGYGKFQRLAAFPAVALPGGERAMREPWRNAYAQLHPQWERLRARFPGLPALDSLAARPVATLARMIERGINSPPASSAGRLFDAAAALLGLYAGSVSFEGQAAMALEGLAASAGGAPEADPYPWSLHAGNGLASLRWDTMWMAFLADLAAGASSAHVAARFHATVAEAVAVTARKLAWREGLQRVVLSGGVFQNRLLLEGVSGRLEAAGLRVLIPARYPLNDGALSLGQAVVAAFRAGQRGEG